MLFAVVILMLYFYTWERPIPVDVAAPKLSFRRDMKHLVQYWNKREIHLRQQ